MIHICKICNFSHEVKKKVSNHINSAHKMKTLDYTIQYLYDGVRPMCPECGKETRYESCAFRKYCIEHSYMAEQEGGSIGGKIKEQWNKGKTKADDERIAALGKKMSGEGNPFYGKKHTEETVNTLRVRQRLTHEQIYNRVAKRAKEFTLISDLSDYDTRQGTKLTFQCNECSTQLTVPLSYYERGARCQKCHPAGSIEQTAVANYVRDLGFTVRENDRTIISPLELDIWVAEKKFAVEYHGLYWHSHDADVDAFQKNLHRHKYEVCEKEGVRLLQVFSDEWRDKREIVESMIRVRLGMSERRIFARKCAVREVVSSEARIFLDRCHISGATRSTVYFGLYEQDRLMMVLALRKPIQKKYGKYMEISRMAAELNTNVVGGAGKLMKLAEQWTLSHDYDGILTYADLRYGTGQVYEMTGFTHVGITKPSYWYTDGLERIDRFVYRAQNGMSEAAYSESQGVKPVWSCGSAIYVKHLKESIQSAAA